MNIPEVIAKIFPPPAVLCLATLPDAWGAGFVGADATEILAERIAEKHVGTAAVAGSHGLAEQLALEEGEFVERHFVTDLDEEIDVLGNRLWGGKCRFYQKLCG